MLILILESPREIVEISLNGCNNENTASLAHSGKIKPINSNSIL